MELIIIGFFHFISMDLLKGFIHFIMFLFGATIKLDNVKYPNILMLINRIIITISIIYLLK